MTLTQLRSNARFRALSVEDQLKVADTYWDGQLAAASQQYQDLSFDGRRKARQRLVLASPTFNDEITGEKLRTIGARYAAYDPGLGADKAGYELLNGALKTSGVAGFVGMAFGGASGAARRDDRTRALQYLDNVERISGRSDPFQAIGNFLGTTADVAVTSLVMSPLTAAANMGVQAAARGIKALPSGVKAAKAVLASTAVLKPKLAFFGPVATESLIEAVPYFFVEEARRKANNEPSALGQGPADVARVLGVNAAADFIIGSAFLGVAKVVLGTGGQLLRKGRIGQAAYETAEEQSRLLRTFEAGNMDPVMFAKLDARTQDTLKLGKLRSDYLHGGAANPDMHPKQRSAWLAQDLGVVWGEIPDGSGYRLWPEENIKTPRNYVNFNELEDDLAYDFYKRYSKLSDEEKATKIRPDNMWAYNRGEMLFRNVSKLETDGWEAADPEIHNVLGRSSSMKKRPVITRSEADWLKSTAGQTTVVEAHVPITGSMKNNAVHTEFNMFRGQPLVRVKTSDTPNAIFIGTRKAPLEIYEATRKEAQELVEGAPGKVLEATPKQIDDLIQAETFKNIDEATSSLMLTRGYDHVELPDGTVEFFSTRSARLVGDVNDVALAVRPAIRPGDAATKVVVREIGTVMTEEFGKSSDRVIGAAYETLNSLDPQKFRDFSRLYLGAENSDAHVIIFKNNDSRVTISKAGDKLRIGVPKTYESYAALKASAGQLIKGLDDIAVLTGQKAKNLRSADFLVNRMNEKPARFSFPSDINPVPWAEDVVNSLGGKIEQTGTMYIVHLPSGKTAYRDVDELVSGIVKKTLDTSVIKQDLMLQGVRMIELPNMRIQLRNAKSGKLLADELDLHRALEAINFNPVKISNAYAPRVVRVVGDKLEFEVGKVKVLKDQRTAREYLGKFLDNKDAQTKTPLRFSSKGSVMVTKPRQFEVYLQKYDVYKTFNNPGDAIAYLKADVLELDDLAEIAWKKGMDLTVDQSNNYLLYSKSESAVLPDLPALQAKLREYPDLLHASRSILDEYDPDIESSVAEIVEALHDNRPRAGMNKFGLPPEFEFPERKPVSAFMTMASMTEQTTFFIESVTKQTGDAQLLKQYRRVEHAARVADTDNYRELQFLDTLFRDDAKKLVKRTSRQKIFYHLGMTSEEAAAGLRKQYALATGRALEPLTEQEEKIAAGLRKYYESMSNKMGISYEKLIHEYMPRLRNLQASDNKGLLNNITLGDDLVGELKYDSPEMKFFAENERTSDLISYALKDDALEVAMLYTVQGNKKLYMNNAWRDLATYAKNTKLDSAIVHRLDLYREGLMGATRTPGEKAVEDFGEKFFAALKRAPVLGKLFKSSEIEMRAQGRELLRSVLGITYISSMGWKPFLAIRNSLQPWTTAAPRLGADWVATAQKKILKDPDFYYAKALNLGVINDKPPVVNQVANHYSAWGKLTDSALQMFKNSDDFTRVWVYEAASDRFDNALLALKNKQISTRAAFEDLSGLDLMDQGIRDETWSAISKGGDMDFGVARHTFAFKFEEETMFPYRASEAPLMFQGVVGKLFGQFGSYSMAYRANIARMFQNAPYAKRAAIVASYIAISTALWGTFNAMKIRTQDFIPFAPALFTGGPWFDIGFNAVKSTGTGYEAEQARAGLVRDLPLMVPGSAQLRYVKKFVQYRDEGDSYRAWLSLTGVPMFED
jgi:hypothetical protein